MRLSGSVCGAWPWELALTLALVAATISVAASPRGTMAKVPGGYWRNPFPASAGEPKSWIRPFRLDICPVTVAEFQAFVRGNPEWERNRVKRLFADSSYLEGWDPEGNPPADSSNSAVTRVSWFAAKAYCGAQGKRLPSTAEWERVATQVPPGVDSTTYGNRILEWYGRPTSADTLPGHLKGALHAFGVTDLVGTVWEWTADFNAAGPADRGEVSARDASFFCGGAAGSGAPGTDYGTYMRYAFRGSLRPDFTLATLGFRCARD